jgi:Secretion system C-terminal sorting domain
MTYYGGNGNETISPDIENFNYFQKTSVLSHSKTNNFYFSGKTESTDISTPNTFQPTIGRSNGCLTKFSDTGSLLWTTYYTQDSDYITSLSVSDTALYVAGVFDHCVSSDIEFLQDPPSTYYGTPNGYNPQSSVCYTEFLSRFNFDGQREWGTYYENSNIENPNITRGVCNSVKTHQDKVYLSGSSLAGTAGTLGTFQSNSLANNSLTPFLTQFNQDGTRNWATYNGIPDNSAQSSETSVTIDEDGNPYIFGTITNRFTQNISTPGAYQTTINGLQDGFVSKFNSNGQKLWGTYYGGDSEEFEINCHPFQNGFYLVGMTYSTTGFSTQINGYDSPVFTLHNPNSSNPHNIFIAHFEPNALSTTTNQLENTTLYPNPNKGNFNLQGNFSGIENLELKIYDNQGRTVINKNNISIQNKNTITIATTLASGVYFVKVFNESLSKTYKMIVR